MRLSKLRHASLAETTEFKDILYRDRRVRKYLKPSEIDACFDIKYYTRYRDAIFKRVGL